MKTKVTVKFYKDSGKYNVTEEYESYFHTYQMNGILEEVRLKFPRLSEGNDFLVEVERGDFWNEVLVKKETSKDYSLLELLEIRELIEELSENLELQLGRLGCCGQGDGKDHRADNDSWGGVELLERANLLLKSWK